MTYATRWGQAWSMVAAGVVGFASLQWSPLIVTLDLLATGAVAAVCLVTYRNRRTPTPMGSPSKRFTDIAQRSLILSCCVVALSTLTIASPALALLAVLLVAATSPVVLHLRRGAVALDRLGLTDDDRGSPGDAGGPPGARQPTLQPDTDDNSLGQLEDHELFRVWRQTFWELRSQPSVDQLACLVALRQACLDELARRDPAALHAWLDSGARASGGPERFWRRRPDHGEPDGRQ